MIELGATYKDKITGFKGVATGECRYISGCNQVLLAPIVKKDGSYKCSWFDVQRVEKVKGKKITLDNSKTPGHDIEAPKR